MGSDDLRIVLSIAAVTLGFVALAWTQLAYATFDEELARLSGIEVGWLESALPPRLTGVVGWAMRQARTVRSPRATRCACVNGVAHAAVVKCA